MKTRIRCGNCQTKLSVKPEYVGKKIRCPRCGGLVRVSVAPVILPYPTQVPSEEPVMAIVMPEETLPDPIEPEVVDDQTVPQDDPPTAPDPKPKLKKKKRKFKSKEETSVPASMWIVGSLGGLFVLGGLIYGLIMAMRMSTADDEAIDWTPLMIQFGIGVPVSLVILIISMFLSSALGGGINFGDAKTAILGALFLVVLVNLVTLIPYVGIWLTLLVWLAGFMTIFGLDPWEARFLLFITWVLHYLFRWFLISVFFHASTKLDRDSLDELEREEIEPARKLDRSRDRRSKEQPPLKKGMEEDDEMGWLAPGVIHDFMGNWIQRIKPSIT